MIEADRTQDPSLFQVYKHTAFGDKISWVPALSVIYFLLKPILQILIPLADTSYLSGEADSPDL